MTPPKVNRMTLRSGEPTPSWIFKRSENRDSHRYLEASVHRSMHIPRACVWSIHTTECWSPTQKKGVLIRATIWMDLEHILLSAVGFHLHAIPRPGILRETESKLEVA